MKELEDVILWPDGTWYYRHELTPALNCCASNQETNMVLKVFHDGSEPGEPMENCCLCRAATRWWWGTGARNVALCQSCAKTAKESDLPTKVEWCAKERQLNPRLYGWQPYGQ